MFQLQSETRGEQTSLVDEMVGNQKIADIDYVLKPEDIPTDGLLIRKGKKSYCRLVIK